MNNNNADKGHLRVVIQLGICRQKGCNRFNQFTLLGNPCDGKHGYPLRNSYHEFKELEIKRECKRCNSIDVSQNFGCCSTIDCYTIGFLNGVCQCCLIKGFSNRFSSFDNQNVITPLVPFYVLLLFPFTSKVQTKEILFLCAELLAHSKPCVCQETYWMKTVPWYPIYLSTHRRAVIWMRSDELRDVAVIIQDGWIIYMI